MGLVREKIWVGEETFLWGEERGEHFEAQSTPYLSRKKRANRESNWIAKEKGKKEQ